MEYDVTQKVGSQLSKKEIRDCVAVIREGGALEDPETAARELPHALAVAIVRAGEDIVGVGAIKRSRPQYAGRIADLKKSGFTFDPQMKELGYVAVLPAHQGRHLSSRIMDSLLNPFQEPLWATTSDDRMKHSLDDRRFVQNGREWPNRKGKKLSLWLRCSK